MDPLEVASDLSTNFHLLRTFVFAIRGVDRNNVVEERRFSCSAGSRTRDCTRSAFLRNGLSTVCNFSRCTSEFESLTNNYLLDLIQEDVRDLLTIVTFPFH